MNHVKLLYRLFKVCNFGLQYLNIIFLLDCGVPKHIDNGNFTTPLYEEVKRAKGLVKIIFQVEYSCNEGFVIHPDSTSAVLNCNVNNGQFEPLLPECVRRK